MEVRHMASYTLTIREILTDLCIANDIKPSSKPNVLIKQSKDFLFDFDYPIFDDSYKNVLETKICKHFFMREIGLETYALFKFKLDVLLNEIMPYHNQMYKSTLFEFNPFYNTDLKTSHQKISTGDSTDKGHINVGFGEHKDTVSNDWHKTNNNVTDKPNNQVAKEYKSKDINRYNSNVEHVFEEENTTTLQHTETTKNTGSTETEVVNNHSDRQTLHSDTPQGTISMIKDVDGYLSGADVTKEDNTGLSQVTDDTQSVLTYGGNSDLVSKTGINHDLKSGDDTIEHSGIDKTITTGTNITNTDTLVHDAVDVDEDTSSTTITDSNNDSNFTNVDDFAEHVIGKSSGETFSEMLLKFRDTFVNIDMDVINDIEQLFMQIY